MTGTGGVNGGGRENGFGQELGISSARKAARAVVFAYHDVGVRCLQVLLDQGVEVALVVTHRDAPGERIWFSSVAELAARHGIETLFPEDPADPALLEQVRRLRPDFLFSFYYRRMLPASLLDVASRGAFNMHGSLLPKYRGRAPVNWAVLHGERETGATLHEMVAKPDAGRIVDQESVSIGPEDSAAEVFRGVTDAAQALLRHALPRLIAGTARLTPQELSRGSYFSGRKPEDGRIDWRAKAADIHNLVRAVAPPFPGAFTDLDGERLFVHRTRILGPSSLGTKSAMLFAPQGAQHIGVICADGAALALLEIALHGKSLSVNEFAERFGRGPLFLVS